MLIESVHGSEVASIRDSPAPSTFSMQMEPPPPAPRSFPADQLSLRYPNGSWEILPLGVTAHNLDVRSLPQGTSVVPAQLTYDLWQASQNQPLAPAATVFVPRAEPPPPR